MEELRQELQDLITWRKAEGFKMTDRFDVYLNCDDLQTICDALKFRTLTKAKGDYHSVPHYRCPTCNSAVVVYDGDVKPYVCKWCGKVLDWTVSEQ